MFLINDSKSNNFIMFKLDYIIKLSKQNKKTLKFNPFIYVTLFQLVLNTSIEFKIISNKSIKKTIILSPFHYKTSKKTLIRPLTLVKLSLILTKQDNCLIRVHHFLNKTFNKRIIELFQVTTVNLNYLN